MDERTQLVSELLGDTRSKNRKRFVVFYDKAVESPAKTGSENRPYFITEPYVRCRVDSTTEIDSPVTEHPHLVEQHPREWRKYQDAKTPAVEGTPVEELTFLTVAGRANLKQRGVCTVEDLANADGALEKEPGCEKFLEWKSKAKAYLDAATRGAPMSQLVEENERLKQELSDTRETLNAYVDEIATLRTELAERRGVAPKRKRSADDE